MEKLQLKHLAPYLPYKLKGNYEVSEVVPSAKFELRNKELRTDNIDFFLNYAKPILRPISDLTKEIEVNGEKFAPIIKLAKIQYPKVDFEIKDFRCLGRLNSGVCLEFVIEDEIPFYKEYHNNIFLQIKSENYDDMILANLKPSEVREKLFEWHFDVFGLIEKGLAIDFNTLNNEKNTIL